MNFDQREVDDILAAAAKLPSARERHDFLERACGTNQALRQELEALLAAQPRKSSAAHEQVPPEVTAPPLERPVAKPPEINPPSFVVAAQNPRKRPPKPTRSVKSTIVKSPAKVLTAIGAVAAVVLILTFMWMSRSRQQVRSRDGSHAAVTERGRPGSSIKSSEQQPQRTQLPAPQPRVIGRGMLEETTSGGTTAHGDQRVNVVTGSVTAQSIPPPEVTSETTPGSATVATPPGSVERETESAGPKDFPVELPDDAKVTGRSQTSSKSSIMFTSSTSVLELEKFFIGRLQKGGYEIMFDGITNEAEGLQGILHARKRANIRDMVMITYTSKGRTSFVQLDWKKPR